jgi:SAM-dependent methyltransferase
MAPPASRPPLIFDRRLVRRRRDRAAGLFSDHDFLVRLAVKDLLDRAASTTRDFPRALAIGGGGLAGALLAESGLAGRVGLLVETDLSPRLASRSAGLAVAADEELLPFADGAFDLVLAPLTLHWTNDLPGALIQINNALKPDGFFAGALFGGATLTELRQSLLAAEAESGAAAARVSPFADARDLGGLLQRARFAMPVADTDRHTVRYADPARLFADLRGMGESNALSERHALGRRAFARAMQIYAERFALPDGRLPATFEIVTATGWAPAPGQPKPLRPGSAKQRLADALGVKESRLSDASAPPAAQRARTNDRTFRQI